MLDTGAQRGDAAVVRRDATDDDIADAWRALSVRYHRLQCAIDRALHAHFRITSSEFETLEVLAAAKDRSMRMSDLATQVHLSQSALSRLVTGLEKSGLVHRTACDTDRRSVFIGLSETGLQRYEQAKPVQRGILRKDCVLSADILGSSEHNIALCGTDDFAFVEVQPHVRNASLVSPTVPSDTHAAP